MVSGADKIDNECRYKEMYLRNVCVCVYTYIYIYIYIAAVGRKPCISIFVVFQFLT